MQIKCRFSNVLYYTNDSIDIAQAYNLKKRNCDPCIISTKVCHLGEIIILKNSVKWWHSVQQTQPEYFRMQVLNN